MRGTKKRHEILPDPKFNQVIVTKFVNNIMLKGKKSLAFDMFYQAIDILKEKKSDEDPLEVFKKGLANATPAVEVRSKRIGGATFQIPTDIPPARKQSIGMKSLIAAARKRHEKSMPERLANEILQAYNEEGAAVKKKEETHRMADANKAFSHFKF